MAKISTERVYHKGSGKEIYCQVNFVNKSKMFVISDFPDDIKEWWSAKRDREDIYKASYHSGNIVGKSFDECLTLARKVYTDFYDQTITEEKIIAYQLKVNHPRPEFHGHNDRNDIFHAPSLALGIEFKILYRIRIGEDTFISTAIYEQAKEPDSGIRLSGPKLYKENGHNGYGNWEKIPYSDKAYTFFQQVEKGVSDLITLITNYFGDGSQVLLDKIEKGTLLNAPKQT